MGLDSTTFRLMDHVDTTRLQASWQNGLIRFCILYLPSLRKSPLAFLKVDVDELKSVAAEFLVEKMPTFLFFKNGKVVDNFVGADKEGLRKII
ncbi:thioredoxin H-type [Tanacetum coccineum]